MSSEALASLTEIYTDSEGEEGSYGRSRLDMSESPSPSSSQSRTDKSDCSVKAAPSKLVSYFDDSVVSEDEAIGHQRTHDYYVKSQNADFFPTNEGEAMEGVEFSLRGDVELPPEPLGRCPPELQEKIVWLMEEMKSKGQDMNEMIQRRKSFRNPSIYEKLIQFCSINEFGTNYSPEVYDPLKWDKSSYYDELAKVQKVEMDQREKERRERTKVEVLMGTAKKTLNGSGSSEEDVKKRKSKWDQVGSGNVSLQKPPAPVLTTAVTGTKGTVISAFGNLTKKK